MGLILRLQVADEIHDTLDPIYQTVRNLSIDLPETTALIGFAGALTVTTYMVFGKGSKDHKGKKYLNENTEKFDQLIDIIKIATIEYLSSQIVAGAEVVKFLTAGLVHCQVQIY